MTLEQFEAEVARAMPNFQRGPYEQHGNVLEAVVIKGRLDGWIHYRLRKDMWRLWFRPPQKPDGVPLYFDGRSIFSVLNKAQDHFALIRDTYVKIVEDLS